MIISGIEFFIIHGLVASYGRCQESEEITGTQLEELLDCVINQVQIEALATEKWTDITSTDINLNILGYVGVFLKVSCKGSLGGFSIVNHSYLFLFLVQNFSSFSF